MTSSVLSSVERKLLSMALMSLLVGISGCGGGTDGNEPTGRVKTKKNITAISLGTLGGGDYGEAIAINNKGQITGASHTSTFNVHGFIWENGVMTDLGTLGGHMSYPSDINDLGQVVGTSSTSSEAVSGFVWEKGVMVDLGVLPGFQYCFPVKINNRGQVVGYCNGYTDPHAFIWEKGVLTDIGPGAAKDINDKGEVVGITSENDVSIGFVWQNGVLLKKITDLGAPPGERPATSVTAINNHSQVVGMTTTPQSGRAFIWDSCEMTILPSLPSTIRSSATTLNDKGQVIGNAYLSSTGRPNAVIWQDGGVMDLGVLPGYSSATALAINNKGQVVGYNFRTESSPQLGFVWQNGTMTALHGVEGFDVDTSAVDINDHGVAVGYASNVIAGVNRPVMWVIR